jgi:hypothetical protein
LFLTPIVIAGGIEVADSLSASMAGACAGESGLEPDMRISASTRAVVIVIFVRLSASSSSRETRSFGGCALDSATDRRSRPPSSLAPAKAVFWASLV